MAVTVTRGGTGIGPVGGGGGMIPSYWDAVFAESLYPSLFMYQFGAKRRIPPNFGITIKITRLKRQTGTVALRSSASYGIPFLTSELKALCAQFVSGTLAKYNGVYGNSDIALLTTLGDVTEFAIRDISRDLALQMDTATRTALSGISNGAWLGGSSAVYGSVLQTSVLKVSDIIRGVTKLRAANNPRWPDGNFPLLVHPVVTYNIKQTLSTGHAGAWTDLHKYGTDQMIENTYRGEIGRLYGARLVETTNVKRLDAVNGVSVGHSGYQNLLLAPEAYYVCEMDQMTGRVIVKGLGSAGALDADNSLATVAAKVFFAPIRGFQSATPNVTGSECRYVRIETGYTKF
jgi:N4-gp56 family major capsid protein